MSSEGNFRSCKVYIGNISDDVKKEHLEVFFEEFGPINTVWVAFCPKGFAFIDFDDPDRAEEACKKLHDVEFMGRKLVVQICGKRPVEENPEDGDS